MTLRITFLAAALLAPALDAGASGIYRCSGAQPGVSYQQLPCAPGASTTTLEIPESYPRPDAAQRERLLRREAALDRRLEAQRERLSREETTRIAARAQVDAARAAVAAREPEIDGGWPLVLVRGRPFHHAPGVRGRWNR